MNLGELLRTWRTTRGLSQKDLAEGICFRTYVSEIERGDRFPTAPLLAAFARRLKAPLDQFAEAYLSSPMSSLTQGLALARWLSEEGANDAADEVLARCRQQLQAEMKPQSYEADFHETEGVLKLNRGQLSDAVDSFHAALQIRQRSRSRKYQLARALFQYGMCAQEAGCEPRLAESALFDAYHTILWLDPAEATERTEKVIELHQRVVQALGYFLLRNGNFHGAVQVYRFAKARWETYGILETPASNIQLGHALAEIGTGNYGEARQILTNLRNRETSPPVLARVHTNLGLLDRLAGSWTEAEFHQRTAYALCRESGIRELRSTLNELIRCAIHRGDFEAAWSWLESALSRDTSAEDPRELAETYLLGGKLARTRGETARAEDFLSRAAAIAHVPISVQQQILLERVRLALDLRDFSTVSKFLASLDQGFGVEPI